MPAFWRPLVMARRNLVGKTALITGASRGIGQAIMHRLVKGKVRVIGITRKRLDAEPLEGVEWVECDLSDPDALNSLLNSEEIDFEKIDILVNCAGFSDFGPIEKLRPEADERHFQVMLKAPIALTRAVLPHMRNRGSCAVVNVSSLAVELPIPYLPLYNAAKAGLGGFTQSLMLDLYGSDVQVIDFRPGDFRTGFYKESVVAENLSRREEEAWDAIREKVAQGSKPERAARELYRHLRSGATGTVRTGSWFECTLASLAARILPGDFMRWRILRYYGL